MTSRHFYSVIQYVPDITSGELVNVGVVLTAEDGSILDVSLDDALRRARRLDHSVQGSFFRRVEERLRGAAVTPSGQQPLGLETMRIDPDDKRLVIQFSEPRPSTLGLGDLKAFVTTSFLPRLAVHHRAPSARTIRTSIEKAFKHAGVESLLEPSVSVTGAHDTYQYDYGLQNGSLRGLVETLSFAKANESAVREGIYAAAYRVQDLREADINVPVTMVAGGTNESESLFATATAIMASADAQVVLQSHVGSWADSVASAMGSHPHR